MYAIVRRYRDGESLLNSLQIGHVHYGFPDRSSALEWNEEHFPSPEYNLIVPCSEAE